MGGGPLDRRRPANAARKKGSCRAANWRAASRGSAPYQESKRATGRRRKGEMVEKRAHANRTEGKRISYYRSIGERAVLWAKFDCRSRSKRNALWAKRDARSIANQDDQAPKCDRRSIAKRTATRRGCDYRSRSSIVDVEAKVGNRKSASRKSAMRREITGVARFPLWRMGRGR